MDITKIKKDKLKHDISALPDHIVGRAEYLKDYFDRNVYEVSKEQVNPLIDLLASEKGAQNIGAAEFSVIPAGTVQSQLQAIKGIIDDAQWGIPDSCSEDMLQKGCVTKEKLSDAVQQRLSEAAYPAECVMDESGIALTAPITGEPATLRFTTPAAYRRGAALTINGEGYDLTMANGKSLPDNGFIAGAVVCIQVDPQAKKAFFDGGGADLSVITAAAEQISEGYVSVDTDGEPVTGTNTLKIVRVDGQFIDTPGNKYKFGSGQQQKIIYAYPDPMFEYDYAFCTARSRAKVQNTSDLTRTYIITSWVIHDRKNGWLSYKDYRWDQGWANYLLEGKGYERGYMCTCLDDSPGTVDYENYYGQRRVTADGIVSFHDVGGTYALDGTTAASKGPGGLFDYAFALYVKL